MATTTTQLWIVAAAVVICSCNPLGDGVTTVPLTGNSARMEFRIVRSAAAATREVTLRAFYRRPNGGAVVMLDSLKTSVQSGTSTVPFTVDIGPCLNEANESAAGGACPLLVAVTIRDLAGALVDSTDIGPLLARAGETVTPGPLQLATPTTMRINRTTSALGVALGGTIDLAATARDGTGRVLPNFGVRWTSSAPTVVSVEEATGRATAQAIGIARLRVERDGLADSVNVHVLPTTTVATCSGSFELLPAVIQIDTTVGGTGILVRSEGHVTIGAGGTLRIRPGTTLCMAGNSTLDANEGTLQAIGTAAQPIRMTSVDSASGWELVLGGQQSDSSRLVFAQLRHLSNQGVTQTGTLHPVRIEDSQVGASRGRALSLSAGLDDRGGGIVRRVTVEDALTSGIPNAAAVAVGNAMRVEDVTVRRSGGVGVLAYATERSSTLVLRNIIIEDAASTGMVLAGNAVGVRIPRIDGLRITRSGQHPIEVPAHLARMLPSGATGLTNVAGNALDTILVTNPSGNVSIEDTATVSGPTPWLLTFTMAVPAGSVLRVEAGGHLVFAAGISLNLSGGTLDVRGSPTAPSILTARDSTVGWPGITASSTGTWSIDRAIVQYTRSTPGLGSSVSGVVPRFTRSVFRRFASPAIFTQAPGVIIEDSRFEDPVSGSFSLVQPVVAAGTVVEIRRTALYGAGINANAIFFQGGSPTATIVVDSVSIDFVGNRGITFSNALTPPQSILLRAINLTRIGRFAIHWPSTGPVLQATGLWFGSASPPPAAASAVDPTPGSVWDAAFVNLLPVAPAPHGIQILPRKGDR